MFDRFFPASGKPIPRPVGCSRRPPVVVRRVRRRSAAPLRSIRPSSGRFSCQSYKIVRQVAKTVAEPVGYEHMATQIKFGTSGWRAIVAEEFTFANVRRAVTGIARYIASEKPDGAKVIVGRDPRFLGETFSSLAADILGAHAITPLVISDPVP